MVKTKYPPEHDFTLTWDEWELTVIREAVLFTVFRFRGRGTRSRLEFGTLREAIDEATTDERALVYAVTKRERCVQVPRARWDEFLRLREKVETPT